MAISQAVPGPLGTWVSANLFLFLLLNFSRLALAQVPQVPQTPQVPQVPGLNPAGDPQAITRIPEAAQVQAAAPPQAQSPPARAALVPASVQLAMVPRPETVIRGFSPDEMELQRFKCVQITLEIKNTRWQLTFEAFKAWLSAMGKDPEVGPEVEDKYNEARALAVDYINCYARLEWMTGAPSAEERRQAYVESLTRDRSGSYSVTTSDETVSATPAPTPCHDETYATYEKRLMTVGFDQNGDPIHRMDWDVVEHHRQVCD